MPPQQIDYTKGGFFSDWKADISAGLVVFLVALPLCLGIALASGAPLFAGVIAGIIGGIVVALISGSEVSVSGPAAGLAVIVADSISTIGSYEGFLTAVVLAGVFQIIFGSLRLGTIGNYRVFIYYSFSHLSNKKVFTTSYSYILLKFSPADARRA